jgi:putative spermidine/putrescine transport system permease protein
MRIPGTLLLLLLPAPIVVVVAASFTPDGYLRFPPGAMSLRWYAEALSDSRWLRALGLSLWIAALTAVAATTIAFLTAWCARCRMPVSVSRWLDLLVLSPLFFPHAALGVALVNLLAAFGLVATPEGIVLAHLVCALPFAYRPVAVAMHRISPEMLEASAILGAGDMRTALRVLLPLCRPGLVTALLFSFIISLDEVTVTMFLTGPDVMTLPVEIYAYIQENASPVLAAVSTAMVVATLALVLLLERLVGLQVFVEEEGS